MISVFLNGDYSMFIIANCKATQIVALYRRLAPVVTLRLCCLLAVEGTRRNGAGVDLYLHQQALDTTTPSGEAMFQMMGVFAEFERSMISE